MKEIDEIRKINEEIQRLCDRREELMNQAVEKHCPFKVGDELPVTDWYHKGKLISAKRFSLDVKKTMAKWVATGTLVDRQNAYEWPHTAVIDESVE